MRQRFVALEPFFALGFALVFKAISSLRSGCAKRTTVWRPRKIRYLLEQETQSPFRTDPAFKRLLQSFCRFPNTWQRPDRLAEPRHTSSQDLWYLKKAFESNRQTLLMLHLK